MLGPRIDSWSIGPLAAAAAQEDELARQQASYAAVDASIEPETFTAPDLRSASARAAARAHGIDVDRWLARH